MEDSDRIVIFEINDLDHDRWDLKDSGDEFLNMVEIAPGQGRIQFMTCPPSN
jgi:hypothetical protein